MFAIVVRFDLRDETAAAEFDAITRRLVQDVTAKEPGTLLYAAHAVEGEPLARVFYEVYRDREAFEAHNGTDHVTGFLEARAALLTARRPERLTPIVAAKGLPG
jgi:quinol monooxygenase YgiN